MSMIINWYMRALRVHPWKTQSLTAGTLMTCGDLICQTVLERKSVMEIDKRRTVRFAILGTFYVGPLLRVWYNQLERLITTTGRTVGLKKMVIDQVVFAPCFLVSFITVKGCIQNDTWNRISTVLRKDYLSILGANYTLWPAAQLVTFYLVPLHLRVLFVSSVALFWNVYLAWKTNKRIGE